MEVNQYPCNHLHAVIFREEPENDEVEESVDTKHRTTLRLCHKS